MGLPIQRSLNGDLDSGLTDGRQRKECPNWGGHRHDGTDGDWDRLWDAMRGTTPVPGH